MTRAVRFQGPGPGIRIGRLEDDAVWDAGPAPAVGFVPTAEAWEAVRGASGACFRLDQVTLLAPVVPPKLLCIGLNYRLHAEETGSAIPTEPVLFCKLPNSYSGPGDAIVLPNDDATPDFEAEMALVIGRRIRRAGRAEARAAIGGITALNDVSARNAQRSSGGQFIRGKSYDTFAPLGPCISDASGLDPNNLAVRMTISGETMQDSNTSDMIFDAEDLIVYISAAITLEPGDVIATGTPSGVGMGRDPKRWLRDGDVCEVEIEGVGVLRNPCVAEA
ncbi:MAG: 2,4-didehydro-3-deoxy-L-rhamnonate hydrolase [Gaiellales bacterium]|jgi:2-keto-4-pentenoate hydratase/2-oxohepta-3-ene-1,7-dioic acid hydratase in catechol pathway|nr:2,4-didehydro-3-deoxy-L-rhamnonate hydrolase [Gaiellales bacterium]